MKPPFIVDDSGDLSIFETLEEAERYLEPNDVEPGKCLAYDSEGCCFEGFDESKWFRHRVRLGLGKVSQLMRRSCYGISSWMFSEGWKRKKPTSSLRVCH